MIGKNTCKKSNCAICKTKLTGETVKQLEITII